MADAGRPTLRVDPTEGQAFRAQRAPMPSSAHCTATPVAAWRRVIASPSVALAFPFGSHASVGDLTSHLNARAASRVSWASAPKPRLPRRGLMLSENACESPAGVRLPARTGRPGSARRANPGESRPHGGFLPRMHSQPANRADEARAQQHPAVGRIGSTSRRTRSEPGCHDIP